MTYPRASSLCAGLVAVNVFVLDVAGGVGVDAGLIDASEGALHLAWMAYYQAACGIFGAFQEEARRRRRHAAVRLCGRR